jgi:anion-transporting  ArsA/GET3 family ATPase
VARTLGFLGLDGYKEEALALATARVSAEQGAKVLVIGQRADDLLAGLVGQPLKTDPVEIQTNLWVVQARTSSFLERSWNRVRGMEEEYLRTPFFKNVYGQELGVIPGFDELFLLLTLREWDTQYDLMVLSLSSAQSLLRLLTAPDQLGWYVRRFQEAYSSSPLSLAINPFLEPLTRAIMAGTMSRQEIGQKGGQLNQLLQQGQAAAQKQVQLFLVTDSDPQRLRQAQRLWGSAELFELQVAGLLHFGSVPDIFEPLPTQALPPVQSWSQWQVPNLAQMPLRTPGLKVDSQGLTVRVFLPGFDKKEIELSQDGPELTLRVADQRRNLVLPTKFQGKRVKGAKFAESALTIAF